MPPISTPWWCSGEKWPRKARIVMNPRIVSPTKTWAPWRPVRPKKIVPKAWSCGAKPILAYSIACVRRKVRPMRKVRTSPACIPARLPRLIAVSAQWIVKLDVTRMSVLTPATNFGSSNCAGGHGWFPDTRTKK